ncbi:MAG: universal stress protein, partial [Gemmatimonadales bacterium]
MHRILVPLDGGPFAEQALDLAANIARRDRAQLDIVAVHAPLAPMAPDEPLVQAETIHTAMRGRLVTYAGDLAERTAKAFGVAAVATVVDGDPATELERFASAHQVDLVVMCTHGRGPVARAWLGSVADRLLRTFDGQLLLLRPDGERKARPLFRTVLVAVDGSALSETAIPAARKLLVADGTLVLARCVAPAVITPLAFEMPIIPPVTTTKELRDAAEGYLATTTQRLAHD